MKKYFNYSIFYLILGLVAGVFYREFTKINNFEGKTQLSLVHTHTLTLGFIFFILVLLLEKNFNLSKNKGFNKCILLYNISLIYVIVTLIIRGCMEVLGIDFAGFSHIAGLGHALLGISLIWFSIITSKSIK
ncbi:DUF2871 domain-containing protein [Clostridium sp.]|uniref:DUF2871 domain-containing protein n=1 Tax=Clostridium sp. TaxID=1506 RepID=UPI00260F4B03|nr:DUF2871 domain-containing protein [Clostridium sp.]